MMRFVATVVLAACVMGEAAAGGPALWVSVWEKDSDARTTHDRAIAPAVRRLATFPGLARVECECWTRGGRIVLRLSEGSDAGAAVVQARTLLTGAVPADVTLTLGTGEPEAVPNVWVALASRAGKTSPAALRALADGPVRRAVESLPGIGGVEVHGTYMDEFPDLETRRGARRVALAGVRSGSADAIGRALGNLGADVEATVFADSRSGTVLAKAEWVGGFTEKEWDAVARAVGGVRGVAECLAFADLPSQETLILMPSPEGGPDPNALRAALRAAVPTHPWRVSILGADHRPFPVRVGLLGPEGGEPKRLADWAAAVAARAAEAGTADAHADVPGDIATDRVEYDYDKMRALGITEAAVDEAVLNRAIRPNAPATVPDAQGNPVPIANLSRTFRTIVPNTILRVDGRPAIWVKAAPSGRPVAEASAALQKLAEDIRRERGLGEGYRVVR